MPNALPWTPAQDEQLSGLLAQKKTIRQAAAVLNVSRSFVQRRAQVLAVVRVQATCTCEREEAGAAPLPAGHPISWGAIALSLPQHA